MNKVNKIGLSLFVLGIVLMLGVILQQAFSDVLVSGGVSLVVFTGVVALFLGVFIILISLIRERIQDARLDSIRRAHLKNNHDSNNNTHY